MRIYSFVGERLGEIDMLLPVYAELKMSAFDAEITVVFENEIITQALGRNPFLSAQLSSVIKNYFVLVNREKKRRNYSKKEKGLKIIRLVRILSRILMTNKPIVFRSGAFSRFGEFLITLVIKIRNGSIIEHPNLMSIYRNEGGVNKKNLQMVFDSKNRNIFSNNEIEIGYPRLYMSWHRKVLEYSKELEKKWDNRTLVTIILPSPLEGVFSQEELFNWIKSIFKTDYFRSDVVLGILKFHPMIKKDILLDFLQNNIPTEKYEISEEHVSVLATISSFVISHHSSCILDSMGTGTPTIFFQKFTPHWMKRHPEKSVFLKLQPFRAESLKQLNEVIENLPARHCRDQLISILNHRDLAGNLIHSLHHSII